MVDTKCERETPTPFPTTTSPIKYLFANMHPDSHFKPNRNNTCLYCYYSFYDLLIRFVAL